MESKNPVPLIVPFDNAQQRNVAISPLPQTILCKLLQNSATMNKTSDTSETTSPDSTVSTNSNVSVKLKAEPKSPTKDSSNDIKLTISSVDGNVKIIKSQNQTPFNLPLTFTCPQKQFVAKYTELSPSEAVKLNPKKRLLQRHLMEKVKEFDGENEDQMITKLPKSTQDPEAPFGRGKNGKPLTS